MPLYPRGKPYRGGGGMRGGFGGGGHWERGHSGRGGRGGRGFHGRGRGGGHRGGRPDFYQGRRSSRSPPPRHNDPEKLLANLAPEAQIALTTAIINSVLKKDGREGRGNFRERDRPRHRDARRDGRGGYFKEDSRDRRHYGEERSSHDPRSYHDEGRGHRYERDKSASGSPRYRNNRYSGGMPRRRPSPHSGHPGPSRKRQRVERMDSGEGSGSSLHHDRNTEGEDSHDRDRDKPRERRRRSSGSDEVRKGRENEGSKTNEKEEGGPDGPSGVQVTIGADGERAVNSEGHVRARVSGRWFVELRCPHCPREKSITFKEYKLHLASEGHKNQLNRLARKHSVVLRKIRVQQRQEQRDIEDKWKEEKPDEFKVASSKFCTTCKLAYKCMGSNISEGISLHYRSKLHRMQRHYLHPRCGICRITFPSRMVYEYHIASISHLRIRTASIEYHGGDRQSDEPDQEGDDDVLDLANFMTLDSVGEDDEEVGSEHQEITEGLDEMEEGIGKSPSKDAKHRKGHEPDEISVDAEWDKEHLDDEDEEGNEAVGLEYVTQIEAHYCSLCYKVIRTDMAAGARAVQRHCRLFEHLARYQEAHPPQVEEDNQIGYKEKEDDEDGDDKEVKQKDTDEGNAEDDQEEAVEDENEEEIGDYEEEEDEYEGEDHDDEGEGHSEGEECDYEGEEASSDKEYDRSGLDEDPEQAKLWEEVDKGFTELQG
ncbi:hypothetical protein SK128_005363 [Halocaridina rubra]|uniref:Uncharacterized protein n=1 Tax=Halocaridina rubra TaxID=373956 RepID=A0AAN8XA73_HALRR